MINKIRLKNVVGRWWQKRAGWIILRGLIVGACMFGTSISGGCSIIEEAIEDTKEKLFQQMGFRWYFVDYSEEGKIALINNDCNPDDWQEVTYTPAELASRGEEEQREYEATMWDRIRDINASPCVVDGDASIEVAKGWVRAFRRIDVNGSLASFELAKAEIVGKLLKQYGPGPSVVPGAPLKHTVLVYLPQGPRWDYIDRVAYDGYYNYPLRPANPRWVIKDDMWDEMHDLLCGCYPNRHPTFEGRLRQLIEGATDGEGYSFPGGHEVCVNSKSYSGHQVGNVVDENDLVFWYNVGPSFGLFELEGAADYSGPLPRNCADGLSDDHPEMCHERRDTLGPNPLISDYHRVLRTSETPQCMITSYQDCSSLYGVGSALTNPIDFQFRPYSTQPWPREEIGSSPYRRSCPPLLGIDVLAEYLPIHDSRWVCDRFTTCTRDCPYLCLEGESCCHRAHYEMNTGGETNCIQTGVETKILEGETCYRYGRADTLAAIYDNLDAAHGGPQSIRIFEAEADPRCDPTKYNCETFPHPVDNAFLQATHMEYFEGGAGNKEPKMTDEIYSCHVDFPAPCLACDKCGNEVMPPTTTDENPTGLMEIWYSAFSREFGGILHCNILPCMPDGVRDPRKTVDNYDVIYLGKNYVPGDPLYQRDYDAIRGWSRTDSQFRLSGSDQTVPLTLHWVVPNDNAHNDQVHLAKIDEKSLAFELLNWFGFINDPTWPLDGIFIEENSSRMSTRNFGPNSLDRIRHGEYSDLAGAWLRLQARGDYWVVHDRGGYLDGDGSLVSPHKTVLIMRWDHNGDGYPDRPLPYPYRLSVGSGRLHAELTNRALTVYDVIPGNGTERGHDVEIEVQDGFPPTVLHGTPSYIGRLSWGDQYRTSLNWDVNASWCRAYPDNIKCPRGTDPLPTRASFTLRVKLINDRNYFYRDYVIVVYRDSIRIVR